MSEFLSNNPFANLKKSHPARVYMEEAGYIRELIAKINTIAIVNDYDEFLKVFEEFCSIEKHFARKENQLFPYLEKYGWTSPSQNMWAFHDQIRDDIRAIKQMIKDGDKNSLMQSLQVLFKGNSKDYGYS